MSAPLHVVNGTVASASPLAARRIDLERAMLHADEPLPYRANPLLIDGCCTLLAGAGGIGKTIVSTAIAKGVQLGALGAGMGCAKGPVAIFDAENGERLTGRRLHAMEVPTEHLHVYDAAGLNLADPNDVEAVIAEVQARGARLFVLDSLRRLSPRAKENDSDHMAFVAGNATEIARRTGAAGLLLHHRGKGDSDYRGSSGIGDQVDAVFVLELVDQKDLITGRRRLKCTKYRPDAIPAARWLRITSTDGTLQVLPGEETDKLPRVLNEVTADVLNVVREHGPISGAAVARALGRPKTDGTVRRALTELVESHTIDRDHRGYTVANDRLATPDNPGNGSSGEGVATVATSPKGWHPGTHEHPGVAT